MEQDIVSFINKIAKKAQYNSQNIHYSNQFTNLQDRKYNKPHKWSNEVPHIKLRISLSCDFNSNVETIIINIFIAHFMSSYAKLLAFFVKVSVFQMQSNFGRHLAFFVDS